MARWGKGRPASTMPSAEGGEGAEKGPACAQPRQNKHEETTSEPLQRKCVWSVSVPWTHTTAVRSRHTHTHSKNTSYVVSSYLEFISTTGKRFLCLVAFTGSDLLVKCVRCRMNIHVCVVLGLFSLLTRCRCSLWNWSPISCSFWPTQASTPRAAGRSIAPRSASLSPRSSKCAGKCKRKPALPVEQQEPHQLSAEPAWNRSRVSASDTTSLSYVILFKHGVADDKHTTQISGAADVTASGGYSHVVPLTVPWRLRYLEGRVRPRRVLTVEQWSGLLCHAAGQHAVVGRRQRGPRGLRALVVTLYLPERGAPAVGVRLKHVVLLILHAGAP